MAGYSLHTLRDILILFFHVDSFVLSEERYLFEPQQEPQRVWSSRKLLKRKCSWKGRPALSRMSAGCPRQTLPEHLPSSARATCRHLQANWQRVTWCWLWPHCILMCRDSREEKECDAIRAYAQAARSERGIRTPSRCSPLLFALLLRPAFSPL